MGVAAILPELSEWTLLHVVTDLKISCLAIGFSPVLFSFECFSFCQASTDCLFNCITKFSSLLIQ